MTSRDFCYWLQGFFELGGASTPLSKDQQDCIKAHLAMVFIHEIDPSMGGPEKQTALNQVHATQPPPKIGGVGPDGTVYRC